MSGFFAALFSGILWAFDGTILAKISLNPLVLAFLHDFLSFLVIFLLIIFLNKFKYIFTIKRRSLIITALASFFGGFIGMGSFVLAISYANIGFAAVFSSLYPVVSVVLANFILKQRLSKTGLFGLGLAVFSSIGLCFLSYDVHFSLLGAIFGLACAFGWGAECVVINLALKDELSPLNALFIRQGVSSICLFLLAVFFGFTINFESDFLGFKSLFLAAIFGAFSYLLYYFGIAKIGALKAMGLNISYSFWAILISVVLGGEFWAFLTLFAVLIIIGSLLTNL